MSGRAKQPVGRSEGVGTPLTGHTAPEAARASFRSSYGSLDTRTVPPRTKDRAGRRPTSYEEVQVHTQFVSSGAGAGAELGGATMNVDGQNDKELRGSSQANRRRLTANTVYLPPVPWYNQIRIPGITKYCSPYSNEISTTKYTVFNFIFKNLWEQFHRVANLYFLFIALLNFVPAVEAFGKEVGFIPLLFVLSVTACKDIFEDYRRYKSDKDFNGKDCTIFDRERGGFVRSKWRHLRLGDFVKVSCDEMIPADVLLLHSSDPSGICYIQTANLDGETNLKQRQCVSSQDSKGASLSQFNPASFTGEVICEQPHNKIYEFNGIIVDNGSCVPVNKSNLLLGGCTLRNTTDVVGIVVYAGHETKAMLNNSGPRTKRSKLERDINIDVISQAVILFVLCLIGSIGSGVWTHLKSNRNVPFFFDNVHPALEAFIRFWTYLIILQVIIPISLYVTMEIVKFIQVYFLNFDLDMYYAPTDRPFQCRALNITEDLGQIQYLFSDKTGTLTENEMVFKCCSVRGRNYPHGLRAQFAKYGDTIGHSLNVASQDEETDFPQPPEQPTALDGGLSAALHRSYRPRHCPDPYLHEFFVVMAICNTVVVSRKMKERGRVSALVNEREEGEGEGEEGEAVMCDVGGGGGGGGGGMSDGVGVDGGEYECEEGGCVSSLSSDAIEYEAESPDEAALVQAAKGYGYVLLSRSSREVTISTPHRGLVRYQVLHVLEFDSERKCMSVIVREAGCRDSKTILYCKGADSAIYRKLAHHSGLLPSQYHQTEFAEEGEGEEEREGEGEGEEEVCGNLANRTQGHLNLYARLGLRTLCLARRVLSEEDYSQWLESHQAAEQSMENRDEQLVESFYRVEQKLELLGATGIEDRLQDAVPETIEALTCAGIKVWVLTGDKQETAINVGFSSKLLDQTVDVIVLNTSSLEELREVLQSRSQELELQETYQHSCHDDSNGSSNDSSRSSTDSVLGNLVKSLRGRGTRGGVDKGGGGPPNKVIVINGDTLTFALQDPAIRTSFLALARTCKSVICCRATPLQKAAVVKAVKEELHQMTLSIGDGANDVSMIQIADVGVGIAGREGMQAVIASDFAMARFKFLQKLLLVHGHWCYSRLANMMLYFFYKNLAYAVLIFWFQLFNGFSGSNPIDGINLQVFNLVYTSLPIIVVAVADQDLLARSLTRDKSYYSHGRLSRGYTRLKFWLTVLDALYQSVVVFFVAYGTVANHVVLWGSLLVTFLFNYVYTAIDSRQRIMDTYWLMFATSARPHFWLVLLLAPTVALLPRFVVKVFEQEASLSPILRGRAMEAEEEEGREKERWWLRCWRTMKAKKVRVDINTEVDFSTSGSHNDVV